MTGNKIATSAVSSAIEYLSLATKYSGQVIILATKFSKKFMNLNNDAYALMLCFGLFF